MEQQVHQVSLIIINMMFWKIPIGVFVLTRIHTGVICGMENLNAVKVGIEAKQVRYETADLWLKHAVSELTPLFKDRGYVLPPIRVHLGWTSRGLRTNRIGECWPRSTVEDGVTSIFLTTQMKNSVAVLDVLMHEMVHAVDDCTHKHEKEFARIAKDIGLVGPPWRSSGAGEVLWKQLEEIADDLGYLPYSRVSPPAPMARELKSGRAICPSCGYSCRTLSQWNSLGPPLCPKDKEPLVEDWRLAQRYTDPK